MSVFHTLSLEVLGRPVPKCEPASFVKFAAADGKIRGLVITKRRWDRPAGEPFKEWVYDGDGVDIRNGDFHGLGPFFGIRERQIIWVKGFEHRNRSKRKRKER